MPKLKHLDLKPITATERAAFISITAREEINNDIQISNQKILAKSAIDRQDRQGPVRIPSTRAIQTALSSSQKSQTSAPAPLGSFTTPIHLHTTTTNSSHIEGSNSPKIYHDLALNHQIKVISAEGKVIWIYYCLFLMFLLLICFFFTLTILGCLYISCLQNRFVTSIL